MQINRFDGGLSKRLLPHLIDANQSPNCVNVDLSKGSLVPLHQDRVYNRKVKDYIYGCGPCLIESETRLVTAQQDFWYVSGVEGLKILRTANCQLDALYLPKPDYAVSSADPQESGQFEELIEDGWVFGISQSSRRPATYETIPEGTWWIKQAKLTDGFTWSLLTPPGTLTLYKRYSHTPPRWLIDSKCHLFNAAYKGLQDDDTWKYAGVVDGGLDGYGITKDPQPSVKLDDTVLKVTDKGAYFVAVWTSEEGNTFEHTFQATFDWQKSPSKIYKGVRILELKKHTLKLYKNGKLVPTKLVSGYYYEQNLEPDGDAPSYPDIKEWQVAVSFYSDLTEGEAVITKVQTKGQFKIEFPPLPAGCRGYKVYLLTDAWKLIDTIEGSIESKTYSTASTGIARYPNLPFNYRGINHLASWNSYLWMGRNRSLLYKFERFDETQVIEFESEILGLKSTPYGLFVWLKHSTYLVTGSKGMFTKTQLSSVIGISGSDSAMLLGLLLLWEFEGAIYTYDGSIKTMEESTGVKALPTGYSVDYFKRVIATSMAEHKSRMFDFFGVVDIDDYYKSLTIYQGDLLGVTPANDLVQLFAGDEYRDFIYYTAEYADGSLTDLKTYDTVRTNSEGRLKLTIIIDGQACTSQDLNQGFTEIQVPQTYCKGYKIQFKIEGKGAVYELNYTLQGR